MLQGLEKIADRDDVIVVILNEISSDHDTEVRLLECSNGANSPKSKTPRSLRNQKMAAGRKAQVATAQGNAATICKLRLTRILPRSMPFVSGQKGVQF